MTWQTFVFILVAGSAFGFSGYRFRLLFKMMKALKGKPPALDEISSRIGTTIVNVLGQKAVLNKKAAGLMHATIFWGFIIISFGTLEQFCTTIYQPATFEFMGHHAYSIFALLQDIFATAVLLAVCAAAYRRFVLRPEGLGKSRDANLVLLFTGSLMVSILLMNGFHIIATHPWYDNMMPVSAFVGSLLAGLSFSDGTSIVLHQVFKWVHMLLVLGFAIYIPGSKHLHIIAAGPNTFLRKLNREKGMKPIPFEDESVQQYGVAKISDMSWKDALDTYSCTECGRCQDVCPAHNTKKPLTPKMLIMDIKANLYRNKQHLLAGQYDSVSPIMDENITDDVIWACTSCRACEIACPVFIEHTDKIFDIRRNLVLMDSKFPGEVQAVFKNMETNATPWAFSREDRAKWAEGLSIKTMAENPDADILLWVGCAGAYDERNKKVMRSLVSILKKAQVKFAILGNEEQCTGDAARRIGNEYLYQTLAKSNIETLNRYNVKKIVTACPHCFNTIKNEYKDFGGNYEVIHHSQYIDQLIASGKIKPTKSIDETITFHDSCYLGRWNGIYDQPRNILKSMPSARMVEMEKNGEKSMCCGAGGGRMWMEEKIGKRINIARTEQALATHASIVATSCPFCITMIQDGLKSKEMQEKVRPLDIAELIDQTTA